MRFVNGNGELDGRTYTRTYAEEVRQALSALDGVLNGDKAIYASSELTTGRRFYELLRAHGARDAAELHGKLGEADYQRLLWDPNLAATNAFARALRQHHAPGELVVTPGPFSAPGWSQQEYLAFWETLLRTRVKAAWFNDGWEYSNGCAFEFAVASDAGLPTCDVAGRALTVEAGRERLEAAARELEAAGFDASRLRQSLGWLAAL
jgi:hypothetical protein